MTSRLGLAVSAAAAVLCVAASAAAQTSPCAPHKVARAGVRISLEATPSRRSDTVRTVLVCLRPAPAVAVGSFHLFVEYDSTLVRASHFVQGASGTIVANLTRPGRADIAGADPVGFEAGEIATLTFATVHGTGRRTRAPGAMVVRLVELNAATGANLIGHATVSGIGIPVTRAPAESTLTPKSAETPHIDSLSPPRAKVPGRGGLVSVTIHGSGFSADGNVVLFAGAEIAELSSADGATLQLVLPSSLPSRGEVPPRMIGPGRYELRVRTSAGTSNPIELTLETPQ